MLVIKLGIRPGGNPDLAREIGSIKVSNVSDLAPVSDYEVSFDRGVVRDQKVLRWKKYRLNGHRRSDGAWELVRRAMELLKEKGEI